MTTAIETRDLAKNFGDVQAVQQLSLRVEQGEVLGLVGPNGAGKTTTMLMMVGLLPPDSGEVFLLGKPFHAFEVAGRDQLGWVPQSLAFYPELTVRENIRFFGSLYNLSGRRLRERVEGVLEACKLVEYADRAGYALSGGLQRRLNLGLGLIHEPRVLVLDEPTVGIDLESRSVILDHLRSLAKAGNSVIMATHYVDEVSAVCDRVAILDQGRVAFFDRREHLYARYPKRVEIEAKLVDQASLSRLTSLPSCSIQRFPSHIHITIEAPVDQKLKPVEWPWILGEILAVLKSSEAEILSLNMPQRSLDPPPGTKSATTADPTCKPGKSSTKT